MKLESQVVSLELAKQLKELGVKQDSKFAWGLKGITLILLYELYNGWCSETGAWHARDEFEDESFCSAFTVAELGEMLPSKIGNGYWIITGKDKDGWFCAYNKPQGGKANYIHLITEQTEADARAKMLIWLIENGYSETSLDKRSK